MIIDDEVKSTKVSKRHRNIFEADHDVMYGEEDDDNYGDLNGTDDDDSDGSDESDDSD